MFSAFKKFFSKPAADVMDAPASFRSNGSSVATAPRANGAHPVQNGTPVRPVTIPSNAPASLPIPLKSILARLPADLAQRLRQTEFGDAEVNISMQKILSQIASGAVKISFAELRHVCPPGTFTTDGARDTVMVEIPLNEILARLNPSLLPRRAVQKHVAVPAEITGPFGGQAQITFTTAPLKAGAPIQAEPAPVAPAPVPMSFAPIKQAALPPQRPSVPFQPVQPAQPAQPFQPSIALAQAAQPIRPSVAPVRPSAPPIPSPNSIKPVIPAATPFVAQHRPAPPVPELPAGLVQAAPTQEKDDEMDTALFNRISIPGPQVPAQPISRQAPIAPQKPLPAPGLKPVSARVPESKPIQNFQPIAPVAPAIPAAPVVAAAPAAPITPIAPEPEVEPAPIPFNPPAPAPAPMPSIAGETRFLNVAIADLSSGWPEAVQQEIATHQLKTALVGLPFGVTELAIKQGKVALPWRILRSWIKPPLLGATSPNDALVLELPLKVITPIFLAELRAAKPQKKVAMDENIPDLFSNKKLAEAPAPATQNIVPMAPAAPVAPMASAAPSMPPAPVATRMTAPVGLPTDAPAPQQAPLKPADTNYFSKRNGGEESQPEEVAPPVKPGPTPGTAFLNRYATPNEIVSKAAALDGVDGALIALPDGLLVANRIPSNMNADTIAAFLPQIFGRVSQCTKELRLGELNNLNFTVGSIPWKIFKVGAIYFAAFGRPGEPLPTAQLAGIAAELDRKAK